MENDTNMFLFWIAVKMGRIPKLEKERALELASQEGKQKESTQSRKGETQKKGGSKASSGPQFMDLFPTPAPQQQQPASLFGSLDESAQHPSRSLEGADTTHIASEMYFDANKPRMMEPKQSISSADSSTDSQSSDYLGQGLHSPEGSTPWGHHSICPAPNLASSHGTSPFTPSFLPSSMTISTDSSKIKTELSPLSDHCLRRDSSPRASLSPLQVSGECLRATLSPQQVSGEGSSPKKCEAISLHPDSFFPYPDHHQNRQKEHNLRYRSSMDYDTDFNQKLFSTSEASSSNSFDHYRSDSCEPFAPSKSNDSTIWDKEILVKLQLNNDSFKTEIKTSDVYAPVRNHYMILCEVEQGGMFNRLPLYIQTLQQLDVCQRTGLLLKLQETPTDMVDKICKMLAMEDRYAVSKEGVSMGKDSTFLIQGTLQRLKYSMDVLWKPIWLMRQYIRQQLSSSVNMRLDYIFKLSKFKTTLHKLG